MQGGQLCDGEKPLNQSYPYYRNVLDVKANTPAQDHAVMGVTCGIGARAVTGVIGRVY